MYLYEVASTRATLYVSVVSVASPAVTEAIGFTTATGESLSLTCTFAIVAYPDVENARMHTSLPLSARVALVGAAGAVTVRTFSLRAAFQPCGAVTIVLATPFIVTLYGLVSS